MSKPYLIMPMGGKGSRFNNHGFDVPKPLIQFAGRPFFYWSAQSLVKFLKVSGIIFIVLHEHVERYNMENEIYKYYPDAAVVIIPEVLNGAVLTCLKGVESIKDNNPVIFNDCDHMFRSTAFETFCGHENNSVDGALLTFQSVNPKYSYLIQDADGNVKTTMEKKVISDAAICGCYYFRNKHIFAEAAGEYLLSCDYDEYYMSGVYNILARRNRIIKAFSTDFHIPYGTPDEYNSAIKMNQYYEALQ